MSYNTNSSYSRTYEKKIIEETPRVRLSSPFSSGIPAGITSSIPDNFMTSHFPSTLHSISPVGLGTGSTGTFHSIRKTDDSIQVQLDVKEFKPEELKVSVVGQFIVVEAKHGEKTDDLGTIERSFTRKIPLPKGVEPNAVNSSLSGDGLLTIVALPPSDAKGSGSIPIKVQVASNGS